MEASKQKPRGKIDYEFVTNSHNIYHREDPITRVKIQGEFYARTAIAIALLMVVLVAVATS